MIAKKLDIEQQISQMLDEVRVVLPGTQTLLGFQLASIFQQGFSKIGKGLQYLHLSSLCCVTLAIIFLMAVPAYDRIVHNDDATKKFVTFSSRMILCALLFLALGLSTDLYVVMTVVVHSAAIAISSSLFVVILCAALWFGYSFFMRRYDK